MALVDPDLAFEKLSDFPILAFEEGDLVLAAGSDTGRLLFMIRGVVEVVKDDVTLARVEERGAVFGEMGVLLGRPHTADVRAVQPSSFYLVEDGRRFLMEQPLAACYVAAVQSARLDAVNRHLIEASQHIEAEQRHGFVGDLLDRIGAALHLPWSRPS